MALLDDIVNAQSKLILPFAVAPILVRCPISVVEQINPDPNCLWIFDPTSRGDGAGYIYLRLFLNKYTPEVEKLAEEGYKPTYARDAVATPTTARKGFIATVTQSREFIYRLIEKLILIHKTSTFNKEAPIKLIDYLAPESGEEFTARFGKLMINKYPEGFINVDTGKFCKSEWEIKFQEAKLRLI